MVPNDALDFSLICSLILLEQIVRVGLSWRFGIRGIQQFLDAKKDLLDRDSGLPSLFFVQNRQTDGSGWVDIWVEERGNEFACLGQL